MRPFITLHRSDSPPSLFAHSQHQLTPRICVGYIIFLHVCVCCHTLSSFMRKTFIIRCTLFSMAFFCVCVCAVFFGMLPAYVEYLKRRFFWLLSIDTKTIHHHHQQPLSNEQKKNAANYIALDLGAAGFFGCWSFLLFDFCMLLFFCW